MQFVNIRKMASLLMTVLAVILCAGVPASAHFPWVSMGDHSLDPGRGLKIRLAWGHHFPLDDFLEADSVDFISVTGPDGNTRKISSGDGLTYTGPSTDQPGIYYVTAQRKPGFFTIKEKGFHIGPKTGIKDAVKCSYSMDTMKAVVNVGNVKAVPDRVFGLPLELVPLTNPMDARIGDYMKIQVLYHGKPVHHFRVYATYEGFSGEGAFAYTNGVDKQGIFNLKVLHAGKWVVYAEKEEPYDNPSECDMQNYRTSLTFEIE